MEIKIVGLKELRENIEKYATRVSKGESFLVMRKSKPIFRLTSPETDDAWETVIDFTKMKKGGIALKDILSRV